MAEFLGASVRRGAAGGRGGSERRRRVRSGVARERAEEVEEAWERVRVARGLRGVSKHSIEGGGGSRRWKQEVAAARLCARHAQRQ